MGIARLRSVVRLRDGVDFGTRWGDWGVGKRREGEGDRGEGDKKPEMRDEEQETGKMFFLVEFSFAWKKCENEGLI